MVRNRKAHAAMARTQTRAARSATCPAALQWLCVRAVWPPAAAAARRPIDPLAPSTHTYTHWHTQVIVTPAQRRCVRQHGARSSTSRTA